MAATSELLDYDWVTHDPDARLKSPDKPFLMAQAPPNETPAQRCDRMLTQVRHACMACSMCELGRQGATKDGKLYRDPHVFSNMVPSRFVVVGQNPGWNELIKCEPFVGAAGDNFEEELVANGLARSDFYICNVVRCFTADNAKPGQNHINMCRPFLQIELNLLRPLLVVTLGALAFEVLCPKVRYANGQGTITKDTELGVPVFGVLHPSPLNLCEPARRQQFKNQMRLMCGVVKKLKASHDQTALLR